MQKEVFSCHIIKFSYLKAILFLLFPPNIKNTKGLSFSTTLFTMTLGKSVFLPSRYNLSKLILICRWNDKESLESFLIENKKINNSKEHWHVKMKPYRKWGKLKELNDTHIYEEQSSPKGPVIGLTLAKLKLTQVFRFEKWGRPVERQVAEHSGKTLAVVSMRPLNKFSTFSVWKSEDDMTSMVHGTYDSKESKNHAEAMKERIKKPFHFEFMTMRFVQIEESGSIDS